MLHPLRAGIVSGQRLDHIKVVAFQQLAQIPRAAFDIVARIEGIRDSQAGGRSRHQLHQPLRALGRHRAQIEPALGVNHAADQVRIQMMASLAALTTSSTEELYSAGSSERERSGSK